MRVTLAIAAVAIITLPLCAQKAQPLFEVHTTTGQTTFHIGERIPLTLSFTGPSDTYNVSLFNFGHVDPLSLDSFAVSPSTGWSDSLATYDAFSSGGFSGTNKRGTLSSKPTTLEVNLNEWALFEQPGTYTVTITSHRVSPIEKGTRNFFLSYLQSNALVSNPLEIHIIPATPKWQQATLDRILRDLATPQKTEEDGQISPRFRAASADLRYLATPAAISLLAANLRDDRSDFRSDPFYGLIGLPRDRRDIALAAMNRLINDPDFPISDNFLQAMPWLQIEESPVAMNELRSTAMREAPTEAFFTQMSALTEAHEAAQRPFLDAAWESAVATLPQKQGTAANVTAQTLLNDPPLHPSPTANAQIGALLRHSFPRLSVSERATLLAEHWDTMRSRSLLPDLRTLATLPVKEDEPTVFTGDSVRYIRAVALERWYELEPENATLEILRQIGSATPFFSASDLDFLPAQSFPQFESLWANTFVNSENFTDGDLIGSLLVRFGTGSAKVEIANMITTRIADVNSNLLDPAFAYLVRFDPETAKRLLAQANAPPPNSIGAYRSPSLTEIAKLARDPLLTEAAISALDSPNTYCVSGALTYLTQFGDETAQKPLLDHYLIWSERQSSKPASVDDDDNSMSDVDGPKFEAREKLRQESQLGDAFVHALLANQAWIPDADLTAKVLEHCVEDSTCEEAKRLSKTDLTVYAQHLPREYSLHDEYNLGVYSPTTLDLFEAKLEQFPKGTVFTLTSTSNDHGEEQLKLTTGMPALFEKHGMVLKLPATQ